MKQLQKRPAKGKSPEARPERNYASFDQLDGRHPWQESMPEGCVLYPVRRLGGGHVAWFNFELAKEMGLIPKSHPHRINKKLENKLLQTFCIRILNEYDQENNVIYPKRLHKEHSYMATRYLQLQHVDKTGRTSGDGRCVWNGTIKHRGVTWDVSSRGTGVTCLAPGFQLADEPLESGNTDFGYGCGLAEIDELYGSAIMSEIMYLNGFETERMLAIVDTGDGCGIGVRAGKNLFRPAHLFMYLKQGKWDALKRATDFTIQRQYDNKEWDFSPRHKNCYQKLLKQVCHSFARFAAQLEREYIFAWLDWDGDNVLTTAGIIDYGSIRQFGVRHDQYRYDDVERYSTTLNEQKGKARLTIQVFAQLVDYLETQEKMPIKEYSNHPILAEFDQIYEEALTEYLLYQVGLKKKYVKWSMANQKDLVSQFQKEFFRAEKHKTQRQTKKVADGLNRPPIFNMRSFLRIMSEHISQKNDTPIEPRRIFKTILCDDVSPRDRRPNEKMQNHLKSLQSKYMKLIFNIREEFKTEPVLNSVHRRSQRINRADRVTGNALIYIVQEIMKKKPKNQFDRGIQMIIDDFVKSQVMSPDPKTEDLVENHKSQLEQEPLGRTFLNLVQGFKEDI